MVEWEEVERSFIMTDKTNERRDHLCCLVASTCSCERAKVAGTLVELECNKLSAETGKKRASKREKDVAKNHLNLIDIHSLCDTSKTDNVVAVVFVARPVLFR